MGLVHVNTHGSACDCWNPQARSHGKSERCHRRPACAMPYTGLTTRQTRVRPSDPTVSPRRSPSGASTGLAERGGKRASGVRSHAWSRRRRTSDLPCGTVERSMSSQLPLLAFSGIANSQQCRGGSVAEWIRAQPTLKVLVKVGRVGLFSTACRVRLCVSRRRAEIDPAGWSGIERDPARTGLSDYHVEVRRVSGVRGGMPSVFIVRASHERCVGAMRAGEGSQAPKSGLQARRAQKGGVLLGACPERTLRESDQCTRVACVQLGNTRQEPDWPVSRVHKERRYSAPESRPALRSDAVRSASRFACCSSRWCCGGMSGRPVMLSRSRTGGGPPSGASPVKKRLTENVEHGGEATIAAYTPAEQRSSKRAYTES
eukprot:1551377-Pleurochrysis_carterae.AAC.1